MSDNGRCGFRRREVLAAGLAAVLTTSGCGVFAAERGSLDATSALKPVLDTARGMMAAYDAAAEDAPALANSLDVLRGNHFEHAKALAKMLDENEPEPGDSKARTLEALRQAESEAAAEAVDACAGAPTRYAVLLGEIAACRSSHHDVLRIM